MATTNDTITRLPEHCKKRDIAEFLQCDRATAYRWLRALRDARGHA